MRELTIIQSHKPEPESEEPIEIEIDRMVRVEKEGNTIRTDDVHVVCAVRDNGEFINHAIWLSSQYDWVLGVDAGGSTCVVPLEKEVGLGRCSV